jgi:hypothetical protein
MRGRLAPLGKYEGAFASRSPACTLTPNTVVGSQDLAVGRFAWADPITGQCSNAQIAGGQYGIAQPVWTFRWGSWGLTYISGGVRFVRAGKPITLYVSGDFWVKFPNGALIGQTVYIDPATGIAYGADGGGFVATKFQVTTNTAVGGLGIISPYTRIGI